MKVILDFICFTWPLALGLVFLGLAIATAVYFGVFSNSVPNEEGDSK